MARRKVIVWVYILTYMWICSRAFVLEVTCWYNQALPLGDNVSVWCHTSFQGRPPVCGLCQLDVMISEQRHQLPDICANMMTEPFAVSFASKHRGNTRCMLTCQSHATHTCNITVSGGYAPYPPSTPSCSVEDPENQDIHCFWSNSYESIIPTTYTLHWQTDHGIITSTESEKEHGIITRTEYFIGSLITVWVTARNELGSAKSQESVLDTYHIIRPEPPIITDLCSHPFLEISWKMDCEIHVTSDIKCQVHHTVDDINWTEVDDCQVSFMLEDPQPFTVYQFRVRCRCGPEEVMSNWSSVHSVRTPPAAPVGNLDIWSDCAPNSDTSFCNIFWKEMPISQARGEVNGYIVMLKMENGTESQQVIKQRRDMERECSTEEGYEWLWDFPLFPGVIGVSVSANTSMGVSEPTFMALPVLGQTTPSVNLSVTGVNQKLVVSWSAPSEFSENIQEYVVQHVSVGPPCLDWVRVNKTQSFVIITGEFKNFTAYNVSLFAVISNSSTFLRSALAYTLQGVPPKVPQFHVKNISQSSVTLTWSHISPHESQGVILQYSVGVNEDTAVNVSSDRTSYQVSQLQPAQQYQAWVSAMTAAGVGERSNTTFSTAEKPVSTLLTVFIVLPLFALMFALIIILILRSTLATLCCGVVPDPTNSKSFKHANYQHVWPGLSSPTESPLKISELEIVENLITTTVTPLSEIKQENVSLDSEPQQDNISDGVQRKDKDIDRIEESVGPKRETFSKDYSQMIDTDEDDGVDEEDEDEEWEQQHCVSDYERHFMPSV